MKAQERRDDAIQAANDVAMEGLEREVAVTSYMRDGGAPIISPSMDVAPGPHTFGDMAMTLWEFVPHGPVNDDVAPSAAAALRACHDAFAGYPGELPPFTEAIEDAHALLQRETALVPLAQDDRSFLLSEYDRLNDALGSTLFHSVALHGDPHLGNAFLTADGPRWSDWEAACRGPIEWDLSCVPEAGHGAWADINAGLLEILGDLRSLCVSVWCWAVFDRSAEKREAARYHLGRMRTRAERAV